jgi:predicted small lipoprotein YifL
MRRAVCLSALGAALLAAGCGQKGPLYLPDRNAPVVTAPATQPQPAPATQPQPAPATQPQPAPAQPVPASPAHPPAAQPKPTDRKDEDSGGP